MFSIFHKTVSSNGLKISTISGCTYSTNLCRAISMNVGMAGTKINFVHTYLNLIWLFTFLL